MSDQYPGYVLGIERTFAAPARRRVRRLDQQGGHAALGRLRIVMVDPQGGQTPG